MSDKLIDTNILVYAYDTSEGEKHEIHLWDAVIAACMKENDITEIVTEDKEDFKKIPDIKVTMPF